MCYIEMCFRVTMLGQYQINKQTNKQNKTMNVKWVEITKIIFSFGFELFNGLFHDLFGILHFWRGCQFLHALELGHLWDQIMDNFNRFSLHRKNGVKILKRFNTRF